MKAKVLLLGVILPAVLLAGCSGSKRYHPERLEDPSGYKAHFPDMDKDGNDRVSWDEFKAFFPQTTKQVYAALDLDKDGTVDHDEWHAFKEAHGLKEH